MDWFKKNPFIGLLAVITILLTGAGVYFVLEGQSALTVAQDAYRAKTGQLASLQAAKPFPNAEALQMAEAELAETEKIIAELSAMVAAQSAPLEPTLTPQQFQDALNARVSALSAAAAEAGVDLPENFYLGFDPYRAQLPSVAAAPLLSQQLASIAEAVELLIAAPVRAVTAVARTPLPVESSGAGTDRGDQRRQDLSLAPFEIAFVADQTGLRRALSSLVTAEPILLVRLLEVVNSQPAAPPKEAAPAEEAGTADPAAAPLIPVVFGQETLSVRLGLAAVSTSAATAGKP
jgi:uncharacterized coiled-coil protein SlyX